MTNNIHYIELTPVYNVIFAKTLVSDKPVLLDIFSHQPLWLLCLTKNSLALLKKFYSLNKNFHHPYYILIFSSSESIKKKLGINSEKTEMYWIPKNSREELFKTLKITELPWILALEEGKIIHSAHDFPSDFTELTVEDIETSQNTSQKEVNKSLAGYKEQIKTLKQKIKKYEKKEIDYKGQVSELQDKIKELQSEIEGLKKKVREFDENWRFSPKPLGKNQSFSATKEAYMKKYFHFTKSSTNDVDIWQNIDEKAVELRNLSDILDSHELWINNLDTRPIKIPNIKPWKLSPIAKNSVPLKNFGSKDDFKDKKIAKSLRLMNKK